MRSQKKNLHAIPHCQDLPQFISYKLDHTYYAFKLTSMLEEKTVKDFLENHLETRQEWPHKSKN